MNQKTCIYLLFIGFLSFLFCCNAQKKLKTDNLQNSALPAFDKEGHRGCRGLMPENTIPAMLKAVELGVTTLEMDAQITRDKKVIISHDAYFNAEISTKPNGQYVQSSEEKNLVIYNMDYMATESFDVGLKPNPRFPRQKKTAAHKPLLSDLIDSVEAYCKENHKPPVFYNIETKSLPATDNLYHPQPAEFVDLLMQVIISKNMLSRVIIQSFDPRTLVIVHQKFPGTKTSLLIEGYDKRSLESQINNLGYTPSIYSPEFTLISDSLVRKCHEMKMKIIPWTVNDPGEIKKLIAMGVDGIITDYPDLF
jgi:glycerophosphoryl diester phosphodiesterase